MSSRQPSPRPTRNAPRPRQTPPPARPDARIFRRRRAVALLILLLLLAGIIAGAVALKNRFLPPESKPTEPAVEQPTGPSEEELANPTDCAAGGLELQVKLAADSLPAGQPADIPVTVRNTGEVPCLVDMGSGALAVEITSGDDAVWSSRHCGAGLPEERRLLLDAGSSETAVLTWQGTRSTEGCSGEQPKTKPGTYRLHVALNSEGGSQEQEQVFGLH